MTNPSLSVDSRIKGIEAQELLACPEHRTSLTLSDDVAVCPVCGPCGKRHNQYTSFISEPDDFYEGRYDNRVNFIPRSDRFLSTLPLRIVLQGYPNAVFEALPIGARVLELGCAGGMACFGHRYHMVGLDLSSGALRKAAENYSIVLQADATSLPLREASVDGVISSCFFEHFDEAGKRAILAECRRVLKPGAAIVFYYDIWTQNPIISFYRRQAPELYSALFQDGDGHIGYASIEINEAIIRSEGFEVERHIYHERTAFLTNSVWQKFAQWPGLLGVLGRMGHILTSGPLRLPGLAALAAVDATFAHLVPRGYARCVTTTARKL